MSQRTVPGASTFLCLVLIGLMAACGGPDAEGDGASPTPSMSPAAVEGPAPITKVSPTPQDGPFTVDNPLAGDASWVAYQWPTPSGDEAIWLMHPDGSDNRQIAAGAQGVEVLPDWSPDGSMIVFATRGDGATEEPLYLYDVATDEVRQLFDCTYPECMGADEPAFSPDGTEVAFVRYLGPITDDELPSDCGIWIGNVETGEQRQVTSNTVGCDREYSPRWSPSGEQLTYWRWKEENGNTTGTAVFVINVDGTGERQLTAWEDMMGDPDWSPDGQWILFNDHPLRVFHYDPVSSNLYRMRPDGSEVEALTAFSRSQLRATQARYRLDGQWIVFTGQDGQSERRKLYIMPADGGAPFRVSVDGEQTHGVWQPAP